MRFLFDTNILIPLEPTSPEDTEAGTPYAADLLRLIQECGQIACRHPSIRVDLARDKDVQRREMRLALLRKYPEVPHPPAVSNHLARIIGNSIQGSNEHCDDLLIAALFGDAVDWLVTEDIGIHKKAARVGIADRTLTVAAALQVVSDLSEKHVLPPPRVERTLAHALDMQDPILDGLRKDYFPEFDEWLKKCKRENRITWIVRNHESTKVAAFCIVNEEMAPPRELCGKVLKICTFKVSQESLGYRYGELLLKTIFEHAIENRYDWAFVTVFEHHPQLIKLLEDFGFSFLPERKSNGEIIFAKPMSEQAEDDITLSTIEYHVRYGPRRIRFSADSAYLVPIRPNYSDRLFPETSIQLPMFDDSNPCGSAIRKAYLCNSSIKSLRKGASLFFYRSEERQGLIAIGVVEETLHSRKPDEIARIVAKRTVYSLMDIETLCKQEVLVILFRQARVFSPEVRDVEVLNAGVMLKAPQSIMKIRKEGSAWIQTLIYR